MAIELHLHEKIRLDKEKKIEQRGLMQGSREK